MSNPPQTQLTEAGLEFRYRIELSWQFSNINFLGLPYPSNQQQTHLGNIFVPLTFHLSADKVTERIPLASILEQTPLVILGDPGSGKTMLSQLLAFVFSTEGGEAWAKPFGIQRLPIVMTLREYEDICRWESLDDMLTAHIEKLTIACKQEVSEDLLKAMLIKGFEQGKIILIWDGIDEINHDARVKLRDFFRSHLANKYLSAVNGDGSDKNLIILTSRFNGYSEVSYDEFEMPTYVINGFDDDDMLRFLNKWYQTRETDAEYREQEKKRITQALHSDAHLKSLASSPFLLSMIVSVARISNGLPVDKVDLYEKIFDAYLVDIQRRRGFEVFKQPKALKRWLSELAWEMCARALPKENALEKTDTSIFRISYEQAIELAADDNIDVNNYLEYVCRYSGLLVESKDKHYSFAHPSFLEYLAALKLRSLMGDFNELTELCQKLLIDERFHDLLAMLFILLYEFYINDRLFQILLNNVERENSGKAGVFFAKLINQADHGLNQENKKKAVEFALTECCKQINKATIESLSQLVNKSIIEQWFDEQDSDVDIDFLITAFILSSESLKKWYDKIILWIDNNPIMDNTNKSYAKTTVSVLYATRDKPEFVNKAFGYGYLLKLADFENEAIRPEPTVSIVNIKQEIIPELIRAIPIFAELYSVRLNKADCFEIESDIFIKSDKKILKIILLNLIDNIIKYSTYPNNNESTSIECQCNIKIYTENESIAIMTEDYGIGIDEGDEEKIFTQGYRSESALRCHPPVIKFIYVDLYFCRELARKMGGDLQLINNNRPTIFKLTLPKYAG